MSISSQSAQIRAITHVTDEFHALLHLFVSGSAHHVLTIIHETADGHVRSYDFKQEAVLRDVALLDADTLYVAIRYDGSIVGAAVIEACLSQVEVEGAVLCPYVLQSVGFDEQLLTDESQVVKDASDITLETQKIGVAR